MKKNKGITLIALVVTIIVLLILAGVTINALFGENGIVKQAQNSNEETSHGNVQEQIILELDNYEIEKRAGNTNLTAIEYLGENGYLGENYDSQNLLDSYVIPSSKLNKTSLGKGSSKESGDVYVIEKENDNWVLKYYKSANDSNPKLLLNLTGTTGNTGSQTKTLATNTSELVSGDYVDYIYEKEDGTQETIPCIVLYDNDYEKENHTGYGIQLISADIIEGKQITLGEYKEFDEYGEGLGSEGYVDLFDVVNQEFLSNFLNDELCSKVRVVCTDPITGSDMYFCANDSYNTERYDREPSKDELIMSELKILSCKSGNYWCGMDYNEFSDPDNIYRGRYYVEKRNTSYFFRK